MFLSAVWTLILTAPIHCRLYIGEQASKFLHVSFNEETNSSTVHLGWPEGEYIFSKCSFLGKLLKG